MNPGQPMKRSADNGGAAPKIDGLLAQRVRGWAAQPQRRAFTFLADGETETSHWTFAELDLRARALAAKLQQDFKQGDTAILLHPPGPDYIIAFLGCLYSGVLAVPAYPARNDRLASRLNAIALDCKGSAALTTQAELVAMQPALRELPDLAKLRWITTDNVAADWADEWAEPRLNADTPAFLQYTSGSTTSPRGVVVTHGNLMHNSGLIYRYLHSHPDGVGVQWLPPYHDLGLIGGIVQTLYSGACCAFMPPIAFLQDPFLWLKAISKYRAHTSGGPNFAYDLCVRRVTPEQKATLDLSCWQVAGNGAEPIHAPTLQRFAETFAECGFRPEAFYPTYGLAESTLFVTGGDWQTAPIYLDADSDALKRNRFAAARANQPKKTLVGCGKSVPGQELVLVDPNTMDRCGPDQVGEVWVKSPSVAKGYYNKPEDSERVFGAKLRDGSGPFLRTGDLAFLRNGELFITGRLKDLCIIRGRNIYPQDVERTVGTCHESLQPDGGAVFTVEEEGTEQLIVLQELKPGLPVEIDTEPIFRAVVQAVLENHEVKPTAVVLLKPSGVLRTSSGKVRRQPCKQAYLDGQLPIAAEQKFPVATCLTLDAGAKTVDQVLDYIASSLNVPREQLDLNQRLDSLPIDSLKAFELKMNLEEAFQVKLPLTAFAQSPTLRDFLCLLGVPLEGLEEGRLPVVPVPVDNSPVNVQFSLLFFSSQANRDHDIYRLYLEGARFADEHDFTAIWTPERHFHEFGGVFPNPATATAALAMVTKRIRLRAGSVVLPLNDVLRVAEEWAVVDRLSGGRVDLAFATGWNPNDFVLAPDNFAKRRDLTFDGIRTVQALWRGEAITRRNGKGEEVRTRVFPPPIQSDFTPWITCSGGAERFRDAGRCGGHVLTALLFQTVDELAGKIQAYRDEREKAGFDPATGQVTLMLHTYLGTDADAVRQTVRGPFMDYLRSSADLWTQTVEKLPELSPAAQEEVLGIAFERYYHRAGLFGTPEQVAPRIRELARIGVNEIASLIDFGIPTETALEGLSSLNELRRSLLPVEQSRPLKQAS